MIQWLSQNWGTVLVCTVLLLILTLIVIHLINNKRKGKNSCSCGHGCSGCAMKDACHAGKEEKKK